MVGINVLNTHLTSCKKNIKRNSCNNRTLQDGHGAAKVIRNSLQDLLSRTSKQVIN